MRLAVVAVQGKDLQLIMQARLGYKDAHFAMQKEMLNLLQTESDRRKQVDEIRYKVRF